MCRHLPLVLLFAWVGLGAAPNAAPAQTPNTLAALRLVVVQQTSATEQTVVAYDFGVFVTFSGTVSNAVSIQLRTPTGGTIPLTLQSDGTYGFEQLFATEAEMNAAFPDGSYALSVSGGGGAASSTSFGVATGAAVSPVLITNYDELQASASTSPLVTWQAIPGAVVSDFLSLDISKSDGTSVFSTQSLLGTDTMAAPTGLPVGVSLFGDLSFGRFTATTANGGATGIAVGRGFVVEFPIYCVPPKPVIATQPQSVAVAAGGVITLQVTANGQSVGNYQWYRDGVAIPGATNNLYQVGTARTADAGVYTVTLTNSAGSATSSAATVSVGSGLQVSTYAGGATSGSADGGRTVATFNHPSGMAMDRDGNLYIADTYNSTIRKISVTGEVTTLAGAARQTGRADGVGAAARFNLPQAVAVGSAGNVFVADTYNHAIRKIASDGTVTTFAGGGGTAGSLDGNGTAAQFNTPYGIAVNAQGEVFVADYGSAILRKITPAGVVTTLAGTAHQLGTVDGIGAAARFLAPAGLAIDASGNLYAADAAAIRKVTPAGAVTTIAWQLPGITFVMPGAIAVDATGVVYIADGTALKRINADGSTTSIAGLAGSGYLADGYGRRAIFGGCSGIVIAASGTFYLADTGNNAIRTGTLFAGSASPGITITSQPESHLIATGSTFALRTTTTGPTTAMFWSKNGVPLSDATTSSLVVSGAKATDSGSYTLTLINDAGSVTTTPVSIAVANAANPGHIANMSIRSAAGSGAQTLTVGLVISGAATATKPILIRGVGPSLVGYGVPDAVPDPVLTVFKNGAAVGGNDNWTLDLIPKMDSVGAFPLANGSPDAAVASALVPGGYSVQLTGKGASGIALAEIYDLDSENTTGPRLINVSARTFAGTGDNILIAGFVIKGDTSRTVLLRGIGPALTSYGVAYSDCLANPKIALYANSSLITTNDDWGTEPQIGKAFDAVGAFRMYTSADAAMLVTLKPGLYSVQVSGVNNTTGVALVEVYDVP